MASRPRQRFLQAVQRLHAQRPIAHPRVYRPGGKLETLLLGVGLPKENVAFAISGMRTLSQATYGKESYPAPGVAARDLLKEPDKNHMRGLTYHYGPRTQVARALLILLEDSDPDIRSIGTWGILNLRVRSLAKPLLRLIRNPDAGTRACAVELLGGLKLRSGLPCVLRALRDPSWEVRWRAVESTAELGGRERFKELTGMLRDPSRKVRCNAVMNLRVVGGKEAAPLIRTLSTDPDRVVRETVKMQLEILHR